MMRRCHIMLLLALLHPCFAYAAGGEDMAIPVEKYSLEEGLIQSMVTFAYTDHNGLLWVGTGGGLHYFDGRSFHVFRHHADDPNSLPDNLVRSMSKVDGEIFYVSTVRNICVFNRTNGTFRSICQAKLSEPICLGPRGGETTFFWTMDHGIFALRKGRPKRIRHRWKNGIASPPDFFPRRVIVKSDTLFIIGDGGIIEAVPQTGQEYHFSSWTSLPGPQHRMAQDSTGKIWVTANGTVALYEGHQTIRPVYKSHAEKPSAFLIDTRGNHWIADAASQKLYRYRDGKEQAVHLTIRTEKYIDTLRTQILFLEEDGEGNIWIGTDGQGLLLYTPEAFRFDVAKIGFVRSIASSRDVWAGTYKNGLWKLSPDLTQKKQVTSKNLPAGADVLSLLTDRYNRLWIATSQGIVVLDSLEKEEYRFRQELYRANLFRSKGDTLILSTIGQMLTFHAGEKISFLETLHVPLIRTVAFDCRGIQWAGSEKHLYRLGENRPLHRLTPESILHNIPSKSILSFSCKLLTSTEGGINVWDENGKWLQKISWPAQLTADKPYGLLPDKEGRIWMSSDRGLACFVPNTGKWYLFDASDNLQSLEFSSGAYHRSADGTLYYGGIEGINGFIPAHFAPQGKNFRPFLFRLTCADSLYCNGIPPENIALEMHRNNTRISGFVTTGDYRQPHKRQYSFMLKGYDKEWSVPSESMGFSYEKIPPGEYTLLAKTIDAYGNASEETALLSLSIPPPFWQKAWFLCLAAIFLVGCIVYVVKVYQQWRYRKIIRAWEQKDALNQERLRIARDLHDDIGAELSRIAILARNKSNPNSEHLEKISEKTLNLIENLRHIIWSTDPRNDTLGDLQAILREYVSGFAEKNGWRCAIEETGDCEQLSLPAITKRNIFLIIKECLNNTWKHAQADAISLSWTCSQNRLRIAYSDNGIGMARKKNSRGNGLRNMTERASAIGGRLDVSDGPDGGTQITFSLPLNP